tara:strand:- start:25628 stop:26170 length:543 start_codon:yes stop_codon:yes gene_type:complete
MKKKQNHLELWGFGNFIHRAPKLTPSVKEFIDNYVKGFKDDKNPKPSLVLLNNPREAMYTAGYIVQQLYLRKLLNRRCAIIDVPEFLIQMTSFQEKEQRDLKVMEDLLSCDLIVFTEAGLINVNESQRGRLYTLINKRYMDNLPFIATCSNPIGEFEKHVGDAIFSRFLNSCQFLELSND